MSSDEHSSSEEDELRKKAIERFFEDESFEQHQLYELVNKSSDFATINDAGNVFIKQKNVSMKDKVGLVACARLLGSNLKEQISPIVSGEDVARLLLIEVNYAGARLSDLAKEGILERVERGSYRARSLSTVNRFVEALISKHAQTEE